MKVYYLVKISKKNIKLNNYQKNIKLNNYLPTVLILYDNLIVHLNSYGRQK